MKLFRDEKMYSSNRNVWVGYLAVMERKAENTQLFQVVHLKDNILRYEFYTSSGVLYDAFELKKGRDKRKPNKFIEKKPHSFERLHSNTYPRY